MEKLSLILGLIISSCTLIGMIFMIYRFFRDPDINAKSEIEKMKLSCDLKHKKLNEDVDNIKNNLMLMKENDLKHIESEVGKINVNQVKIFTILEERLPNKK